MIRVVNTARDISERKRAEEALEAAPQSEDRFRAFVMASSDAVYRMSTDWKEIHYLKGNGFISHDDSSAPWSEKYVPEEDRSQVLDAIEKAIRNKSVFELEHRVIRADGTVGWMFSRAVPLLNEQGEIMEWLGTTSDVTKRDHKKEKSHRSNGKAKKVTENPKRTVE